LDVANTPTFAKLRVSGGLQIADDASTPSAATVGTMRYRTSGSNSYADMVMQTGASTYEWVTVIANRW
jgi:hypothetical protein